MIKQLTFRGAPYNISCTEREGYQHPSWFSFDDESDVRDRDWKIESGDVVLDVGAAYGSYSLTALAAGASQVFAWSPQGPPGEKAERELFAESLELNDWSPFCRIYDCGCYDKTGWLNASTQEFHALEPEPSGDIIRVERLDDWLARTQPRRIDWMKLDVEGAEVEVLKGAENLLLAFSPKLLIELHLFKDGTLGEKVKELLADFGYIERSRVPYHAVAHAVFSRAAKDVGGKAA
jgi:FkbM family methyltransferase